MEALNKQLAKQEAAAQRMKETLEAAADRLKEQMMKERREVRPMRNFALRRKSGSETHGFILRTNEPSTDQQGPYWHARVRAR